MNYDVIEAKYVSGYIIRLKFRDGATGEIDLTSVLWGPIFEPLRDPEQFKQFRIDEDFQMKSKISSARSRAELKENILTAMQYVVAGNV